MPPKGKGKSNVPPKGKSNVPPKGNSNVSPKAQSDEHGNVPWDEDEKPLSDEERRALRKEIYREAVLDLMYEHIQYCCTCIIMVLGKKDPVMAEELANEFEKYEDHYEERWVRLRAEQKAHDDGTFLAVIPDEANPSGSGIQRVMKNPNLNYGKQCSGYDRRQQTLGAPSDTEPDTRES
ncbi:hypothetical protein V8F06_008642 [Rhypophila decipiens]